MRKIALSVILLVILSAPAVLPAAAQSLPSAMGAYGLASPDPALEDAVGGDSRPDPGAQTGTIQTSYGFVWVRSGPGTSYRPVGRLAPGASVTILATVNGQAVERGNPTWYQIGAGRYVYSDLVRLTQAPSPSSGEKWIEIILSQQRLIAHEGNRIIMDTKVSTGKPRTPTVTGTFRIYAKYRYKDMRGPGYYLPRVPATMFFYRGYALHGTYWHNNFGHPMSHGCVNMRTSDAWIIFNWAPIGTKVVVHR